MAGLIDSDLLNRYHTRGVVPIDTRLTQAEADITGKGDTLSYDDENAVLSLKSGSTVLSSVSVTPALCASSYAREKYSA